MAATGGSRRVVRRPIAAPGAAGAGGVGSGATLKTAKAVLAPEPLPTSRGRERFTRWTKILSAYFTTQTLVQLLGIASGLLFVNFMPVREFALYTLAFSVITFFTFVSDLGSTTSLVFFFRQAKGDREEVGRYVAAVLSLRRLAFLLGAGAVLLIFPRIAVAKGFGLRESLLSAAGILLCVWFQLSASVRVLALRLADRYGLSYRAEITGGGVRLVLALLLIGTGLLRAWLGVLVSSFAAAATALVSRTDLETRPDADLRPYRAKVLRYLLPSLPSGLYFSIQGPLTVWLATTFGSTRNIAEVGALGRLGLVVGIFSSLTGVVFLPRLAQIHDERTYRARYFQFGAVLLAVTIFLVLVSAAVPELLLALVGKQYAGLRHELMLLVGGAGLSLLGGYAVAINLARSWNRWEGLAVVVLIAVQAVLVTLLPLSTTSGVLKFNLLSATTGLLLQLVITAGGFTRPEWVRWMT